MKIRMLLPILLGLLVCTGAVLNDAPENLDQAVCPLSGNPASADHTADWNGGTVYFCCPNCPGPFSENPEAHAAKANHQLVVTGQAQQTGCPISGHDCDAEQTTEVGGVSVCFCCENCLGAVEDASGDEQVEMVFGEEAFAKGFEVGSE